ncbi:bifunctional adenosylcobinamide kinase/adenosylcobinamide-phosphate guanylyltransferase [Luteipulveratus halotolerans]|nr:bifunctional adenosylcobinamide kinase/adenosylcobinamide-phosphate guanylyltransferase [Luteipulveratus halotolerans]
MTTTLVLGGARSGKSRYAESLLDDADAVTYIATGPLPDEDDGDWKARVEEHQARRAEGWTTVESTDVTRAILSARAPSLVDCIGNWVTGTIDAAKAWDNRDKALTIVQERTAELVALWTNAPYDIVAVTNEVGMSVVPETASGRLFQDALGRVNATLSAVSDRVHLIVAGRVIDLSSSPVVPGALA